MSYDLADLVPLTVNIEDLNNQLADATSVALIITRPDGTTDSPPILNPAPGVYQTDYAPAMPGLHSVRWAATGVNTSGFSDTFDVRAGSPPYLVSLADTKQYLNIVTSTNDEQLRGFIESATAEVENVIGPVILRTITEVHTRPGPVIQLQQPPAVTLVSLSPVLTTSPFLFGSQVYDVSQLDLDPATGIVRRLDGYPIGRRVAGLPPSPLRAVYTAGRLVVPAAVTMAAKVIIDDAWSTQRGHSEGTRPSPGGGGAGGAAKKGRTTRDTIPPRALKLLQPYRQPYPVM